MNLITLPSKAFCSLVLMVLGACSSEQYSDAEPGGPIGIDLSNMDSTAIPSQDFFRFVNGKWLARNTIPPDQGTWGSFDELRENNNTIVLKVLKKAAESDQYGEGSDQRKAADFFGLGMDSLLAEELDMQPVQVYLDHVEAISGKGDLQEYLALQETYGGGAFFAFGIFPDLKNSKETAAYLLARGLGLPDRDYYLHQDEKSKETQNRYVSHVAKLLGMIGEENTDEKARTVMEIETRLARATLTKESRRNTDTLYNKMNLEEVSVLTPSINWHQYLTDLGTAGIEKLVVTEPLFLEEFERILDDFGWEDIKVYLKWHVIQGAAPYLSHQFVKADFDFYSNYLKGIAEMRPRWKRVLQSTGHILGEAIGKLYVEETFPPEAKQKALEMVENIKLAFAARIKKLDWMSDSTKQKALDKLSTFVVKIGYPDQWKDYVGLMVETGAEQGSYFQNVLNGQQFLFRRNVDKLGKPVDKKEWQMNPQAVNAYYNPLFNEIVFPAGILQPPFYDYRADEAVNYGGIGAVIGHEISHGFDDQGSRFDAEGNLKNWWGEDDLRKFREKSILLVEQFNAYEPLEGVKVNGRFTLGENIGDLGGISVAYDGLQRFFEENGRAGLIDGLTPEQRFFISWATIWRNKYKDETLRTKINTDPHPPAMYRANGPLSNLEVFYQAFDVNPGDAMYRPDSLRVKIW